MSKWRLSDEPIDNAKDADECLDPDERKNHVTYLKKRREEIN